MDLVSVTLDEVFAAAQARSASLVPETSGYLALAIADASARLPFRIEDTMVTLTTEGSVHVARGTTLAPPEESARRLRDMLSRLLSGSVGSMPALSAAARARGEAEADVDTVIRELETALVPVNRAAARRALARLARETVRAKSSGRLRRRRPAAAKRPEPATTVVEPPHAPAPAHVAAPVPSVEPAPRMELPSVDVEISADPPAVQPVAVFHPALEEREPTPTEMGQTLFLEEDGEDELAFANEPETAVEALVAPIEPANARARRSSPRDVDAHLASLGHARRSDVEALLTGFVVSTLSTPESMRETRASLKRLAGLDPTPPPPAIAEVRRLTRALEAVAKSREPMQAAPVVAQAATLPLMRGPTLLLMVALLLVAGLLGHFLPQLLSGERQGGHALTSGAEE